MARPEATYDIAIIGGGPVGLYALYTAGIRQMTAVLIESLEELGGQLMALYPEKYIYDVAGFPKVLARDLVAGLKEQALQFGADVRLGEQAIDLARLDDGMLRLVTTQGEYWARSVVISAGIGAFTPNRLPLPEIPALEGKGIYYFVTDVAAMRGKRVLVVGGGDSAVDWALTLQDVAERITLIHRAERFKAHEHSVELLMRSPAEVLTPYELKRVHGTDRVTGATVFNNQTGEERDLDVDAIIIAIGFKASLGPIKNWGLDIEKNSIRAQNTRMETNIPGVYACGDIVTYPGKVKLIATGFGEAATAVNNAKHYIDPKAAVFPGHSSAREF